jgi:xanthine permease XanP
MLSRSWARARKLWRGSGEGRVGRQPTRPLALVYSVDEAPPPVVLVLSALQQVALMSNSLVYPIILGRAAGLSPDQLLNLVSLAMLGLAIATILICVRSRLIGCGYLCPAAYTQIYLGVSLSAVQLGGLPLMFGMTFLAGLMQLAIAPSLRRARALLPPEIAGLVIAITGLSLAIFGVRYSLGLQADNNIEPRALMVAAIVLITMVGLNVWTKGHLRVFCSILGIGVGYAASAALGLLPLSAAVPAGGLALLRLPRFDVMDWHFNARMLAPFAVVALAGTLHLMGNIATAQRINDVDWVRPNFGSLIGGLAGNGIASMIAALFGGLGINSYSSSIGLSIATGVTSRSIAYVIGIIFAVLALVPPAACVVATIPSPVIGAAVFFTGAFVFTNGLQMITGRLLDTRKIIVIGFSFSIAITADVYHDVFAQLPGAMQPVFGNALVLGTICAVLLNAVMRIGVHRHVTLQLAPGYLDRDAVGRFLAEQEPTGRHGPMSSRGRILALSSRWRCWADCPSDPRSTPDSMSSTWTFASTMPTPRWSLPSSGPARGRSWPARMASACSPAICCAAAPIASAAGPRASGPRSTCITIIRR